MMNPLLVLQLYEAVTEGGVTKNYHYLTAGNGLFAIFVTSSNGEEAMYYTLKDHQGSLAAVIQPDGDVERLSNDAWGRRRNADGFGYDNVPIPMFDRGFTLHEHYDDFGLINMNGRLYDPVMSSFLSPDNYVQSPNNSQNFNRYSYCLNNPLKYTDPSGESIIGSFIGGIALGIIQNGINNSYYDRPFFENWEAGAAAGGMQAMFSIGIGELTQGINKPWMQSLARAGLHAGSCALNAKFDNRDVLAAAAAGFVGSIVTGGIEYHTRGLQNYHRIPAMIAGGAISSGAASEMMGGDFMDGFYDGLFVAGFNHAMHLVAEGVLPDDPPEKNGSGLKKAAAGSGAATASELYYSEKYKTWMGKNFKIYKQTWGGNGVTGGKLKFASRVSKWFDGIGYALGINNAISIANDYFDGKITLTNAAVEETSNVISTLGGVEGAAWGIGWELGRCVTNMEWYQEMKFNILYNDFEKHFGPPSPTNEQIWYERFYNQKY